MKLSIPAGSTSQTVNVWIQDSSSATGAALTGLAYNTSGLTAYYALPRAAATSITLATQTVTGSYSSGGFVEISSTNMPGWYRFDIPDAALASGSFVDIHLKGATNMAPLPIEIALTSAATDPWATALPGSYSSGQAGYILGNRLKIASNTVTNTGLSNFEFVMVDSAGVPKTALTVTGQRSIDGGAFAACTNSAAEVANGLYKINLSASDLNGSVITLRFTATGAQDRLITVVMVP